MALDFFELFVVGMFLMIQILDYQPLLYCHLFLVCRIDYQANISHFLLFVFPTLFFWKSYPKNLSSCLPNSQYLHLSFQVLVLVIYQKQPPALFREFLRLGIYSHQHRDRYILACLMYYLALFNKKAEHTNNHVTRLFVKLKVSSDRGRPNPNL